MNNVPLLIQCAVDLFTALATGIPQSLPAIIKAVPLIVGKMIEVLFETDWLDIGAQILILNTNKIKEKICAEIQYIRDCRLDFF
mgnify:CR=1 FL=1